jgi:DNA-binding MarR family transcriptional regulator
MSALEKETARPERRVMRLQMAIAQQGHDGMRLGELATALKEQASTVLRTLRTMEDEGFAERVPGREDFWRLAPRGIQIWRGYEAYRAKALDTIDTFHQRVTRELS